MVALAILRHGRAPHVKSFFLSIYFVCDPMSDVSDSFSKSFKFELEFLPSNVQVDFILENVIVHSFLFYLVIIIILNVGSFKEDIFL